MQFYPNAGRGRLLGIPLELSFTVAQVYLHQETPKRTMDPEEGRTEAPLKLAS